MRKYIVIMLVVVLLFGFTFSLQASEMSIKISHTQRYESDEYPKVIRFNGKTYFVRQTPDFEDDYSYRRRSNNDVRNIAIISLLAILIISN